MDVVAKYAADIDAVEIMRVQALKMLADIPVPTRDGNIDNWQGSLYENTNYWNFSQRVDVNFSDFMTDPFGTIGGIYDRFGLEYTAEAESAMRAFLAAHPGDGYGTQ